MEFQSETTKPSGGTAEPQPVGRQKEFNAESAKDPEQRKAAERQPQRSADIPVRSKAGRSDGVRKFGSGTAGGRCCGQECPRSVAVGNFLATCSQAARIFCARREV